jgi:hypothetical protein
MLLLTLCLPETERSMNLKLTQRSIDALRPGEAVHWDVAIPRFGLRVKPTGVKSYLIQYRNPQGVSKRLTIGQHGTWTPELARERAKELLRQVDTGNDPVEARQEDREVLTVEQLCREYAEKLGQGLILGRKGRPKKDSPIYTDKGRIERHIIPILGSKLH